MVALAAGSDLRGLRFSEETTTVDRDFLADGSLGPAVSRDLLEQVIRAVRLALGEVLPEV